MVKVPTLREMLEAGVHFGHKTARWNPKMSDFVYASKSGVHVINLEKTQEHLEKALNFLKESAKTGKKIIFVGTKKQAQEIVKKAAINCGMPYVTERWLGGTLTNFSIVQRAFKKLEKAKIISESQEFEKMRKREKVRLIKEIEKSEKLVGGLVNLNDKPDVMILIGAHDEKNAIKEAKALKIPTIALCDTNSNPKEIDYPIPANDDATKSIELFCELFSKTIIENKLHTKEAK